MTRPDSAGWDVSVHRDLESLTDKWKSVFEAETNVTGIVHIGFWRSDVDAFDQLAASFPGKMLLTASARYSLERIGQYSTASVAEVEGIPIFIALAGWGYESTEDELGLAPSTQTAMEDMAESAVAPRPFDWFAACKTQFPSQTAEAEGLGIVSDETYIFLECHLSMQTREILGKSRFAWMIANTSSGTLAEIAGMCPPLLLDRAIESLNLSVRAGNVLSREMVVTVRDLCRLSDEQLLAFANFGRRCMQDVRIAICRAAGLAAAPSPAQRRTGADTHDGIMRRDRSDEIGGSISDVTLSSPTFANTVHRALCELRDGKAFVMRRRMGLKEKRLTLQEVAEIVGVTRERIRQIESKCVSQIKRDPIWIEVMENKIRAALAERESGLPLAGLEVLDDWFIGVSDLQNAFAYALSNFGTDHFHLVEANGQVFVSTVKQTDWNRLETEGGRLLESAVGRGWRESDARRAIYALLDGRATDLREEMYISASRYAVFAAEQDAIDPALISYGRGAEGAVKAVLTESDRPLHYSEIVERVSEKTGRQIDTRRAHNAAATVGLLYGRGTYGLMKHFPLTEDEAREITEEVEGMISREASGKQWHCSDLCDRLGGESLDFDGRLTPYVLNIALKRSGILADLGRLIWTAGLANRMTTADRIDIRQAVEAMLRAEGQPMTGADIRRRLQEDRGVGRSFQIHMDGNLIRLGTGLWGLADRDIPLTRDEQEEVVSELEAVLAYEQQGIHVTELLGKLSTTSGLAAKLEDATMIAALAQRTERMKLMYGGYLCFKDWTTPRRPSVADAIRTSLERAGPSGIDSVRLREQVSSIIGRRIHPSLIYGPLSSIGARWNGSSGCWQLPRDDEINSDLNDHENVADERLDAL
jgi:hypothetical protein